MQKKLIPLSKWAKQHGWDYKKAKDSARAGRLKKVVEVREVMVQRYFIDEAYAVPGKA